MADNRTDLDIKKMKIRLPHQLRTHPDFGSVKIQVDEDRLNFQLNDSKTGLPALWVFDSSSESWTNVEFLSDAVSVSA